MNWILIVVVAVALCSASCSHLRLLQKGVSDTLRPTGERIGTLACREITESSGIACSRVNKNILWTHNDSDNAPTLYAFNLKGEDLGRFTVMGAQNVDWEDMASYRKGRDSFLVISDAGDNLEQRPFYTLYVVEEPYVNPRKRNVKGVAQVTRKIDFQFDDGPQNCEAIAVDPETEIVYLVSKHGRAGCKIYELPIPAEPVAVPVTAKTVLKTDLCDTTAMDISGDGRKAILLTYTEAYAFTRQKGESWAQAFSLKPAPVEVPFRKQGESVAYDMDGKVLYLTSEGDASPLLVVDAP